MASLMEELLGVLEKEETEYLTLIDLADVKSQAIIKADIAKLGEVTEKEQEAASTLLNLSNKRTQVLNDMATVLGKKPEQMTINRMIGYLENQPREQQMLAERRDRLLEVGTKMQTLNHQNEALLKQAMEMVEFDLTLLKSMRQAPETLFRLREAVGPMVGMNLDPSHLFWMGGDPIEAARVLGEQNALYHVHGKDSRPERRMSGPNGLLDTKPIDQFRTRSWNYVAVGCGHGAQWWKEFFSTVRMAGYDGDVSLEMEDLTMPMLEGHLTSLRVLKEALVL